VTQGQHPHKIPCAVLMLAEEAWLRLCQGGAEEDRYMRRGESWQRRQWWRCGGGSLLEARRELATSTMVSVKAENLVARTIITLLYGSETWVLSQRMRGMLEGFHNRCARQMTRQFIRPDPESEGEWITPPVAASLAAADLLPLMTYVEKRKAKILVFAERRAIYRKCRRSAPIATNVNQLIWWQLQT
jgi:hypothetical protein